MTKVYNISTYGIAQQLGLVFKKTGATIENAATVSINSTSDLKHLNNLNSTNLDILYNKMEEGLINGTQIKGKSEYYAPGIDGRIILTRQDIYKIAKIIDDEIFVIFPSLNYIYTYLLDIADLMCKLNLLLTWITPSGIKITQNYLKSKTTKLAIKLFGIKKTLILRKTVKETNNMKQINAIIPNIVLLRTLDAAHLMNVVNSAAIKNIGPVITAHDCLGTYPNAMLLLQQEVKKSLFHFIQTMIF